MLPILEQLPYFNKETLGRVLDKRGENLNYWIKRLIAKEEVISLKKGLYVARSHLLTYEKNPALKELYLEYMANIIRYPSYVSLEYALGKYGAIPEGVYAVTSITLKSSRDYKNKLGCFVYRNLKKSLYSNFDFVDFEGRRIKFASQAKALFDYLYLKKVTNLSDLRINWEVFGGQSKKEFRDLVELSKSVKMKKVLKTLKW